MKSKEPEKTSKKGQRMDEMKSGQQITVQRRNENSRRNQIKKKLTKYLTTGFKSEKS